MRECMCGGALAWVARVAGVVHLRRGHLDDLQGVFKLGARHGANLKPGGRVRQNEQRPKNVALRALPCKVL